MHSSIARTTSKIATHNKKFNQNVILKVRTISKQVLEGEYKCENS
jgi:hypothetical protein